MSKAITKIEKRTRRKIRSRARLQGTADRPRLAVHRGLSHLFVQLINDDAARTLVSAGAKDADAKVSVGERAAKVAEAYRIGYALGKKALDKKITAIVFDRSGYQYHGRVQALADGARDAGLLF